MGRSLQKWNSVFGLLGRTLSSSRSSQPSPTLMTWAISKELSTRLPSFSSLCLFLSWFVSSWRALLQHLRGVEDVRGLRGVFGGVNSDRHAACVHSTMALSPFLQTSHLLAFIKDFPGMDMLCIRLDRAHSHSRSSLSSRVRLQSKCCCRLYCWLLSGPRTQRMSLTRCC